MSQIKPFLLGAVAGAGLLYVLDPVMGRTRRKQAVDEVVSASHSAQRQVSGKLDLATDKVTGAMADKLPDEQPANAQTLVAKVRSEVLGNADYQGYTINVDAAEGVVSLRGEVATAAHRDAIAEAVEGVTGVDAVENLLHLPDEQAPNVIPSKRASKITP